MLKTISRVNQLIADIGSSILSSMWFGWVCLLMIAAVVAINPPTNLQALLLDFFSIFLQTLGLVFINYTTSKESLSTRTLLRETHDTVMLEQAEIKQIITDLAADFKSLRIQPENKREAK